MSIEKQLERIADALEGHVAAVPEKEEPAKGLTAAEEKAAKAAVAKAKATTAKAEKADGPGKDDVRKAVQGYMAIEGKDAAIDLLKKHGGGAENMSDLEEKHFAAVIEACG